MFRKETVVLPRRAYLIRLIPAFLAFAIATSKSAANTACGDPPQEWREFLKLEQSYNVPRRPILKPEEIQTQLVYEFEFDSANVTAVTHSRAMRDPKVPAKVSVYVAESWIKGKMDDVIKKAGAPIRILCGQRIQGHSTVFTWDPEGKQPSFFVKKSSITQDVTRLFEKSLKQSNVEGIRFLPEVETTSFFKRHTLEGLGFSPFVIGSTRRELAPSPGGLKSELELVPLHGLLGSPKLDEIAAKLGVTREEWIRTRYLPKLADYFAKLHFQLGFYTESHTQNLLLEFNRATGEIQSVVVRDFYGMLPDYLKLMTQKRIEIDGPENGFGLNLGLDDAGMKNLSKFEISQPGVNFGSYSKQSIIAMETDLKKQMEYGEIFLRDYLKHAEAITGKPLELSSTSKDVLKWFEQRDPDKVTFGSQFANKQGTLGAAFTEVIQDVHENVAKATAVKMTIDESPIAQKAIRTAYEKTVKKRYYRTFSSTKEAELELSGRATGRKYAYDGDRIYVLDAENRVVGATFGVEPKQRAKLDKLDIRIHLDVACPERFSRLSKSARHR